MPEAGAGMEPSASSEGEQRGESSQYCSAPAALGFLKGTAELRLGEGSSVCSVDLSARPYSEVPALIPGAS